MIDERRRQQALDALGILDTAPDERVDRITRIAKELFDVPMVSVTLIDRDRQWRKSEIGLGGREAPREDAFCDVTVRQDATLVVEDASTAVGFSDNPFVAGEPHLRFYAGEPLHAPGGEAIGTLCLLDTVPRGFDDDEQRLLRDLALWVQTELAREQELDHAALVQRNLTPRTLPTVEGYTVAGGSVARGRLAGDFYDLGVRDGRIRVTLADVMGKGTGPAIIASAVRASLRTEPSRSLEDAVAEVDRLLEEDLGDLTMFVTAVHGDVHIDTGLVELVDAGHSLAFVMRKDGTWTPLRSMGLPLGMGMTPPEEREVARAVLEPGDALMCCSDGLLDVLDPDDPFGHAARALRDHGPEGAVAEALRLVEDAIDDITVIVVRRDA